MAVNSHRKGGRRERWVAKKLGKWWGSKFRRTPQSGGSALAEDWRLAGDVATKDPEFPFCVEVKDQESWHMTQLFVSEKCKPWKWWEQAVTQTLEGDEPILIFTRKYQPVWIMMYEEFFSDHHDELPMDVIFLADNDDELVMVFLFDFLLDTNPQIWRRE